MKLYTRRGDDGETDLFGGGRAAKDDARMVATGTVDELNSVIGLAAAACDDAEIKSMLVHMQTRLFEVGADLATPRPPAGQADRSAIARIGESHITELEHDIDRFSEAAPTMTHFILPGGCELAARLHVARTVCRRAERCCVSLAREHHGEASLIVVLLNRLGDLLFAMARCANHRAGCGDVEWLGRDA